MSLLRVQLSFPNVNVVPEDTTTNTLHFGTSPGADDAAEAASIKTALLAFFNDNGAGRPNVRTYLSKSIKFADARIKVYRLNDATPRVPILDEQFGLNAPQGDAMPNEVAVCLSYKAAYTSGQSQASLRGRIFVGPVGTNTLSGVTNARVHQNMLDAMYDAGQRLVAASVAAAGWQWVVYSPKLGVNATHAVVGGWVDDAFDTQRRRGVRPLNRFAW
jgi:hypothetical protein